MLTLRPEIKVFTRIVGKKGDTLIVAYYAVALYDNGRTEVLKTVFKTIKAEPVAGALKAHTSSTNNSSVNNSVKKSSILFLSGTVQNNQFFSTIIPSSSSVISPYQTLLFFVSQPTRAPSFLA